MTPPVRPEPAPWLAQWIQAQTADATRTPVQRPTNEYPVLKPANAPMRPGMEQAIRKQGKLESIVQGLEGMQTALENAPWLVGDFANAGAAVREGMKGNYGQAAGYALAALPMVAPIAVKGAAKVASNETRAAKNTGKAALATVDFRGVSPEEALDMARRGDHLRQMPGGQYVGAPGGTNSPAKLGARRRAFDALVEGGELGLDWYPRARESVVEMAGPVPARQRMAARSLGNFSSQANPDVNLGFHLQAHNAYEAGVPAGQVRTRIQAQKYNTARDTGTDLKLGPKQEPYVNKFDPTQDPNHIPTNDIWHGRSWGFVNPDGSPWSSGFSGSQHTWLDGETILAADRANRKRLLGYDEWNASSVQAAPWVYLKGKSLHEKFPKSFPTLEAGVAEAAKTYGDHFPKYTVFGTHESVPGVGTGHLPGLADAPLSERQAFDRATSWADEHGRDVLYDAAGLHQRPMNDAVGAFTPAGGSLEVNPAHASRPLAPVAKDAGGATIDGVNQSILNQTEGLRAYLDAQNTGAWHRITPDAKAAVSTSVRIPLSRPVTDDEMRALAAVAEKHGFGVSDTGEGITLMNFGDGPANGQAVAKALKGELGAEIKRILPDARDAFRGRLISGAVDFQDELSAVNAGSGKATRKLLGLLDDPVAPAIGRKLGESPTVRAKAAANASRDEAARGLLGPVRPDIQTARRIFSQEGIEGLRKALGQGVPLPVLMATLGLGGLLSSGAGDE